MVSRLSLLFVLCLCLVGCGRESEAAAEPAALIAAPAPLVAVQDLPGLSARLERDAASGAFSGGVLVARGDRVLFRQVYGLADREADAPLTLDSRFRLASVSKQFTAAAILKLQDQGVLGVDDPVCRWVRPCNPAWSEVTLHHLLSHTSGIPDLMQQADWGLVRVTPKTPAQLTATTAEYRPSFAPGSRIRYSNAGYNLLGVVVEAASGRPLEQYLRETFFEPLGMADTGLGDDPVSGKLAMGYANFPAGVTAQPNYNPSIIFASGAMYSTLDDLLRWNRALHRGDLLSAHSYGQMIAAHNPPDEPGQRGRPPRDFGYGLFTAPLGGRVRPGFYDPQIYHTGSWSGFRNLVTYQPGADVTVIVLANNFHQREAVLMISQLAMAEALGRPLPESRARDG